MRTFSQSFTLFIRNRNRLLGLHLTNQPDLQTEKQPAQKQKIVYLNACVRIGFGGSAMQKTSYTLICFHKFLEHKKKKARPGRQIIMEVYRENLPWDI